MNIVKCSNCLYENKNTSYIDRNDVSVNPRWIDMYKVYISYAYGAGEGYPHQILNKPFVGEKVSCCTETYLVIGPFKTQNEANNVCAYISTKFFLIASSLRTPQ